MLSVLRGTHSSTIYTKNPPLHSGAGGKQTINMKKLTNAFVFSVFPFVVVFILIGPLLIG